MRYVLTKEHMRNLDCFNEHGRLRLGKSVRKIYAPLFLPIIQNASNPTLTTKGLSTVRPSFSIFRTSEETNVTKTSNNKCT